jgi:hypothetical protein
MLDDTGDYSPSELEARMNTNALVGGIADCPTQAFDESSRAAGGRRNWTDYCELTVASRVLCSHENCDMVVL